MTRTDFIWSPDPEPHGERKKAILAKYGAEVGKLQNKPEYLTIPIVFAAVAVQLSLGVALLNVSWPVWIAVAWAVGGTINHSMFLAVHEITHFLAMKSKDGNKLLSMVANLAIGIPYSITFHGYHMEHHRYQGHDHIDTDIPTSIEGFIIQGKVTKFLFCVFQILFYALRPCLTRKQIPGTWHLINWLVVGSILGQYVAWYGWGAWGYLVASTFCAGCLHPMSGHFLSEHFHFGEMTPDGKPAETYSYYGPLNVLAFNVGYHNEHHDFPNIAWTNLPKLRKIAPEFYDPLPQTKSWPGTIWRFITTDTMGGYNRVKRNKVDKAPTRERSVGRIKKG